MANADYIDFEWEESEEGGRPRFDPDDPVLYEPTALWDSVVRAGNAPTVGTIREGEPVELDPRRFTNKTQYEMVLTRIIFASIGQIMARQVGVTTNNALLNSPRVWNAEAQLGLTRFRLAGRGRQQFSYTYDLTGTRPPRPVGLKTFPVGYTIGGLDLSTAAALDNVFRFDFDRPYWTPPTGGVQFDIAPYAAVGDFETQDDDPGRITLGFSEQWAAGGAFRGHSKFVQTAAARAQTGREAAFPVGIAGVNASNGTTTAFGGQVPPVYPIAAGATSLAEGTILTPRRQKAQRENAGGASRNWITGFYVSIDQIEHDIQTTANVLGAAYFGTQSRLASLASRVGVRARSFAGGTQRRWWRDFIPLPLIAPQRTTGYVHTLPEPIVLAPTDSIQVELNMPFRQGTPIFNIGVSLTGYIKVIA